MKALIPSSAFVVIYFLFSLNLHAQSGKSIILIDGVPNEVILGHDGKIEQVIKALPEYMSAYDKSGMYTKPTDNQEFQSLEVPSYGAFKVIYFKPGEALLSDATVEKLDAIVNKLKHSSEVIMLSTSSSTRIASCSHKITKNRINACKRYLEIKGIDSSRIVQSVKQTDRGSAKIEVYVDQMLRP